MRLNETKYYEEFLRYFEMAKWQQENCNLGTVPYSETPYDDDLIKNVFIYDVVERKYAGFGQLLLDIWYNEDTHPYSKKLTSTRRKLIDDCSPLTWTPREWFYIFLVHRLTGSGINYAQNPSGYHNSILPDLAKCEDIDDMTFEICGRYKPMFTSDGYQIAPFPKVLDSHLPAGKHFLCYIAPTLVKEFYDWILDRNPTFRDAMEFLREFNSKKGCKLFHFQYGAFLADIADFFPHMIQRDSAYFYGSNARECLSYLAVKPWGMSVNRFLDAVTEKLCHDTDSLPYNIEDVACDFIRWIENYINPKSDYSHIDMDTVFSSSTILDHPFGRQKAMLELGLVDSFNGQPHPSDDKILRESGTLITDYLNAVKDLQK